MTDLMLPDAAEGGEVDEYRGAIEMILELERAGAIDEVSLNLTDSEMPYQRWEDLGRFFGTFDRRFRWYLGDWLIFGEAIYGEEHAQGVESTTAERYSEAERVTGLDHGTLMNIRSICSRIPRSRRRKELGFWIHQEVAALEPDEQTEWLQRAIDHGLNQRDLRQAIKDTKNPPSEGDDPVPVNEGAPKADLAVAEQIEFAARLVYNQGSITSDGDVLVPRTAWVQLASALGEE